MVRNSKNTIFLWQHEVSRVFKPFRNVWILFYRAHVVVSGF